MQELTHEEVLREIRIYIATNHNLKTKSFAEEAGVSVGFMHQVLRGDVNPSRSILNLLGIKVKILTTYEYAKNPD